MLDEPFDSRISDTRRMVYGKRAGGGITAFSERLGEHPVADFAAARRADRLALAHRVRREVVVEEELLRVLVLEAVNLLFVGDGTQRSNNQRLRFATLEECRAVRAGQHADFARQVAQLFGSAAVDAGSARG